MITEKNDNIKMIMEKNDNIKMITEKNDNIKMKTEKNDNIKMIRKKNYKGKNDIIFLLSFYVYHFFFISHSQKRDTFFSVIIFMF